MGRIDTLKINGIDVAEYEYIGSRVAWRSYVYPTPDDVNYEPSYDNLGRITSARTYQGATDITRFDYTFDANTNNIARQKLDHRGGDPCNLFSYDDLDRLLSAQYGVDDSNEVFTIDDLGNRDNVNLRDTTDVNYVIDNLTNRYTSIDSNAPEYDNAGNLTKDWRSYEYQYDYENRISKITKDSNDIAYFTYDALGRRIEVNDVVTSSNTRRYYYGSGWQVLSKYNDAEGYRGMFIFGNDIDEVLYSSSGNCYIHDHLGSIVALTSIGGGTVNERYEYDAYGEPTVLEPNDTPDAGNKSDYTNPYLFTGRRVDYLNEGDLKLQYNRNRYYDYYTGRWATHDPKRMVPNEWILRSVQLMASCLDNSRNCEGLRPDLQFDWKDCSKKKCIGNAKKDAKKMKLLCKVLKGKKKKACEKLVEIIENGRIGLCSLCKKP